MLLGRSISEFRRNPIDERQGLKRSCRMGLIACCHLCNDDDQFSLGETMRTVTCNVNMMWSSPAPIPWNNATAQLSRLWHHHVDCVAEAAAAALRCTSGHVFLLPNAP